MSSTVNLAARLAVSLLVAIVAYTLSSILFTGGVQLSGGVFDLRLFLAFALATATTALVIRSPGATGPVEPSANSGSGPATGSRPGKAAAADANRESGEVKWFNVTKGFGFIIKDDGEEIFVHFRSIRGEGRRSLRDGQRVTFVVAQSDKGPQAEDVVAGD